MTTQAQAPTEEMRKLRQELRIAAIACLSAGIFGHDKPFGPQVDAVARTLEVQDALAVERERERCAKWHDEQADNWLLQSHKELGGPERFECRNQAIAVFIFSVTNEVAK